MTQIASPLVPVSLEWAKRTLVCRALVTLAGTWR